MNIDRKQIKSKREIGTLDGHPVLEIITIGGLHMVVLNKNGQIETLGIGPHRAVARHIAKKRFSDFKLSELAKSEEDDPRTFADKLPEYEALTDRFNK